MSGAIRPPAASSSFARSNDFFFYKRLKDVAEFTEASSLGASLTLCGMVTIAFLFLMELVAFVTVTARQELVLAPHSTDPIMVTFNITFPGLRCELLSFNTHDVVGSNHVNISKNVHKYTVDSATGRALMRVADHPFGSQVYGDDEGDFHSEGADEPPPPAGAVPLSDATFDEFIKSTDIAMVAFGAAWCPWSRRLAPVWEEVAGIIEGVLGVKLVKADCSTPSAMVTCMRNHIAAYPTIILFKGGDVHSHVHYHGDRTAQALLDYLVAAQADDTLVTNPNVDPAAQDHAEAMARKLGLLPEGHQDHDHGAHGIIVLPPGQAAPVDGAAPSPATAPHDPADPGRAWRLIEAVHKAGLVAPGDAARKAAAQAAGNGTGGDCAPPNATAPSPVPLPPAVRPSAVGCMLAGAVEVKRVPGTLSVTFGGQGMSVAGGAATSLNTTHVMHELYFGKRVTTYQLSRLPLGTEEELHRMRGQRFISPADPRPGHDENTGAIGSPPTLHEHYLSVVGSAFRFGTGYSVETFRYTANSHQYAASPDGRVDDALPLVKWRYELSPIAMVITEARRPLYHFVTQVCAIIGGVFTVIGLIDSLLHASLARLAKARLGKQS